MEDIKRPLTPAHTLPAQNSSEKPIESTQLKNESPPLHLISCGEGWPLKNWTTSNEKQSKQNEFVGCRHSQTQRMNMNKQDTYMLCKRFATDS